MFLKGAEKGCQKGGRKGQRKSLTEEMTRKKKGTSHLLINYPYESLYSF